MIAAVGDIACDPDYSAYNGGAGTATECRQRATSDIAMGIAGLDAVVVPGDPGNGNGALSAFKQSYEPTWGRLKSITRPVPGNHDYYVAGAAGYFDYFGARAGDRTKGYYSYDLGAWHLVALNSNCSQVGGCGAGSAQLTWLKADLAAHPAKCTLAYWHHPLFSSGEHGNDTQVAAMWDALVAANAEVVLSGHDHDYERFAPQTSKGTAATNGIREFVVGTGGKNLRTFPAVKGNSEARGNTAFGVLKMTLHPNGLDWQFLPEAGKTYSDYGTQTCH